MPPYRLRHAAPPWQMTEGKYTLPIDRPSTYLKTVLRSTWLAQLPLSDRQHADRHLQRSGRGLGRSTLDDGENNWLALACSLIKFRGRPRIDSQDVCDCGADDDLSSTGRVRGFWSNGLRMYLSSTAPIPMNRPQPLTRLSFRPIY